MPFAMFSLNLFLQLTRLAHYAVSNFIAYAFCFMNLIIVNLLLVFEGMKHGSSIISCHCA